MGAAKRLYQDWQNERDKEEYNMFLDSFEPITDEELEEMSNEEIRRGNSKIQKQNIGVR